MLRQLPIQMDDNDLITELNMLAVPYRNVRLIKSRDPGINRGFAFIDFSTVDEAQRWMAMTKVCLSYLISLNAIISLSRYIYI